jgi:hypothetical protein
MTTPQLPPRLQTVPCCGTCKHHQGWADNAYCGKYEAEIKVYQICDSFTAES